MMERSENINDSSTFRSHCFPTIRSAQQVDVKDNQQCSDQFRPLYQHQSNNPTLQNFRIRSDKDGDEVHDPLAEARKKGFERGLEEGKAEACKIAHQELEPSLNRLSEGFDRLVHGHNHVAQDFAQQIIELSMALAQKIIGDNAHSAGEAMDAVRHELASTLEKHYQLILQVSSEDMGVLNDLTSCRNLRINGSNAIQVIDADSVPQGQPFAAAPQGSLESLLEYLGKKVETLLHTG